MRARKIVHIDIEAFYASVKQRDDPQLRGKPVVAWRGNRSVVCAASYEARTFGVRCAMPDVGAERLCPNATFLLPDFPGYRAKSVTPQPSRFGYTDVSLGEAMEAVKVGRRGTITVPAKLRKRYGIGEGSLVTTEAREDGVLIRPAIVVPFERYTPERKAEFLLSTATTAKDNRHARRQVTKLGLDPDAIPHRRPS
jgi:DNA polymerase-4